MSTFGLFGLVIAFAGVAIGSVCLLASQALRDTRRASSADTFAWAGAVAHILAFIALTFCCGLLVFCFMTGDFSVEYVLLEHSEAEGALGVLYRFAGLWAGREGSLLLWAWLISAFNVVVAVRVMKHDEPIDCMALLVSGLVLVAFVAVMLFSESNMPFTATAAPYIDSSGRLTNTGSMQGMNPLLEHWAQAIHPPTLFIGYAGLTIPFAYAIAALIVNDPSKKWVERSSRFAMISWLFLGIGIGLGCVWAYVVLGWGGYWGWDAVENASLLSWCVALALVHSFTVYRKRGAFKRWSIMCACITFAFVITGTFITRSGIVQSVHAFEGDPVSLVLFGGLIAVSMLVGVIGLFIRWKSFCPGENDVMESFASRDAAYYFNNVIMIVFTVILCYLTVASALPSWLPFGGQSLSAGHVQRHRAPAWRGVLRNHRCVPAAFLGENRPQDVLEEGTHSRIVRGCAVRRAYVVFRDHALSGRMTPLFRRAAPRLKNSPRKAPCGTTTASPWWASPWRACCSSTRCSLLAARLVRAQRPRAKTRWRRFSRASRPTPRVSAATSRTSRCPSFWWASLAPSM